MDSKFTEGRYTLVQIKSVTDGLEYVPVIKDENEKNVKSNDYRNIRQVVMCRMRFLIARSALLLVWKNICLCFQLITQFSFQNPNLSGRERASTVKMKFLGKIPCKIS